MYVSLLLTVIAVPPSVDASYRCYNQYMFILYIHKVHALVPWWCPAHSHTYVDHVDPTAEGVV